MKRRIAWMLLIVLLANLMLFPVSNSFAIEAEDIVELPETDLIVSEDEDSEEFELPASPSNLSRPPASASNLSSPPAEETNRTKTATPSDLQSNVVWDENELNEWIEQHQNTGGTVSLGANVTITQTMAFNIGSEITVATGAYSLIYNGGSLPSGIFITGEGLDSPVLDVYRINEGFFYESNWNNTLMELNVTAIGRDGKGGTAMRILNEDPHVVSADSLKDSTQGMIRSYGEGAIGLWLDVPMEAWCYQVDVVGENSMAVYAPNGADLYYCRLTAEGGGASAAAGSNVVLDTCAAAPESDSVINRSRSLVTESLQGLYMPVRQDGTVDIASFSSIFFSLSGGDGYQPVRRALPIAWDDEACDYIDTKVPGKHHITGYLYPPFQGVGLDNTFFLTVEVREPALPCIAHISAKTGELGKYFYLSLWESYEPADGSIILWRSDDEGETWWDATWAEDILWKGSGICFFFDTLKHPVWFKLELVDVGNSNTVVLSQNMGLANGALVSGFLGGDRTGTDREDALSQTGDDNGDDSPGEEGALNNGGNGQKGDDTAGTDQKDNQFQEEDDRNNDIPGDRNEIISGDGSAAESGGDADRPRSNTSSDGSSSRSIEDTVPKSSADIPPLPDHEAEIISSDHDVTESMPIPDTGLRIPPDIPPEVIETQTAGKEDEVIETQFAGKGPAIPEMGLANQEPEANIQKGLNPEADKPLPEDPEQTAPQPDFPVKALTIFFVIAAVLSCGVLLILQLWGKWRHR